MWELVRAGNHGFPLIDGRRAPIGLWRGGCFGRFEQFTSDHADIRGCFDPDFDAAAAGPNHFDKDMLANLYRFSSFSR
jgi:hypothetical protein